MPRRGSIRSVRAGITLVAIVAILFILLRIISGATKEPTPEVDYTERPRQLALEAAQSIQVDAQLLGWRVIKAEPFNTVHRHRLYEVEGLILAVDSAKDTTEFLATYHCSDRDESPLSFTSITNTNTGKELRPFERENAHR